MDLGHPILIKCPNRWTLCTNSEQAKLEIAELAEVINQGTQALGGVYMRICDTIRNAGLLDSEVRKALSPHFPPPRISEILKVCRAPEMVYARYHAGFFGFRAALSQ